MVWLGTVKLPGCPGQGEEFSGLMEVELHWQTLRYPVPVLEQDAEFAGSFLPVAGNCLMSQEAEGRILDIT